MTGLTALTGLLADVFGFFPQMPEGSDTALGFISSNKRGWSDTRDKLLDAL